MRRTRRVLALSLALAAVLAAWASAAAASEGGEGTDGEASWRLEQPLPPAGPGGVGSQVPIGLGKIGDIEFWAPNRGLLITAGNPRTIPGIWFYNGVGWHGFASQCGATDGRIAWAGAEEFWTVSDGRPGQSTAEGTPPLADNTLCHFAGGQIVGSYASLAFQPTSYQAMHAAACFGAEDCWFAGDPLPDERKGDFHLHWNGRSVSEEPGPQGHTVGSMAHFGRGSTRGSIEPQDLLSEPEPPTEPSLVHGSSPKACCRPSSRCFPTPPSYRTNRGCRPTPPARRPRRSTTPA